MAPNLKQVGLGLAAMLQATRPVSKRLLDKQLVYSPDDFSTLHIAQLDEVFGAAIACMCWVYIIVTCCHL